MRVTYFFLLGALLIGLNSVSFAATDGMNIVPKKVVKETKKVFTKTKEMKEMVAPPAGKSTYDAVVAKCLKEDYKQGSTHEGVIIEINNKKYKATISCPYNPILAPP